MKIIKLLPVLLAFVAFTACSEDDRPTNTRELPGVWKLDAFIGDDVPNVVYGQIRWNFNMESETVTITDNSSQNLSPIDEGTYGFTYIAPTEANPVGSLLIDGTHDYEVSFEANALILDPLDQGDGMVFFR